MKTDTLFKILFSAIAGNWLHYISCIAKKKFCTENKKENIYFQIKMNYEFTTLNRISEILIQEVEILSKNCFKKNIHIRRRCPKRLTDQPIVQALSRRDICA